MTVHYDAPTPLPRSLNGGRYQLGRLLGQGGMAVVVAATDRDLGVERAVKIVLPGLGAKSIRRRLKAEARAMARIHHPHILAIHDVGRDDELDYVVMTLAEGGCLQDLLDAKGALPPAHAAHYMVQVLTGLAVAHANGIVHRDVKPQNVLLDKGGRPLLADFGIALLAQDDRRTRAGATMGSMMYMPPEQRLDASSVGPTADIYSSGATLYALSTGQNPVDLFAESPESARWAVLPDALRPIVQRACEPAAELRWQTAGEMATALMEVLEAGQLDGAETIAAGETFEAPHAVFSNGGYTSRPEVTYVPQDLVAGSHDAMTLLHDVAPPARPTPERPTAPSWRGTAVVAGLLFLLGGLGVVLGGTAVVAGSQGWAEAGGEPEGAALAEVVHEAVPSSSPNDGRPPPPPEPAPAPPPDEPAPAPEPTAQPIEISPVPQTTMEPASAAAPEPSPAVAPATPAPGGADAEVDPWLPWGRWRGQRGAVAVELDIGANGRGRVTTYIVLEDARTSSIDAAWDPADRTLTLNDHADPPAVYDLVVSEDGSRARGTVTTAGSHGPISLRRDR